VKRAEFRGRVLAGGEMLRVMVGDVGGCIGVSRKTIGVSRETEKYVGAY
jgi:hypothetical protein